MKPRFVAAAALLPLAILLASAPLLSAQGVPIRIRRPPGPPTQSQPAAAPSAAATAAPAPAAQPNGSPAPTPLPSLLQEPAKPAAIRMGGGSLAIDADNSSLSEILREISRESGMKIDGLNGDERVFGSFGPGKPFAVLSDLLNGTQYNVMMVGSLNNGAPRRLSLLPLHGDAASPPPAATADTPGGGGQNGDADAVDTGLQAVRTPQQMFEQLQAMRQQQLQRQQQQQPPQPTTTQPTPPQAWQHPPGN